MAKELRGAALSVADPSFTAIGRLVLEGLYGLRPSHREKLLFGPFWFCLPLQKAVQRFLGGVTSIRVEFTEGLLRGKKFDCLSSEKYFLLGGSYESEAQDVLRRIIRPGDVVYDIGAHAGYTALLLSELCGRDGRVFAFEPSPTNFRRLLYNVELNRKGNITLVNLAASDDEHSAPFAEVGTVSHLVNGASHPVAGCSQVKTVRLDDFVYRDGNPPPKILKIDIEGHASQCLRGAQLLLQTARPHLVCEVHDPQEFHGVHQAIAPIAYRIGQVDSPRRFPRHILATPM